METDYDMENKYNGKSWNGGFDKWERDFEQYKIKSFTVREAIEELYPKLDDDDRKEI
jgi:hypothetical protein